MVSHKKTENPEQSTSTGSDAGIYLWLILMKAHRAMEKHAMLSIEASGLCFSDFMALEVLLHKGSMPVNSLSDKVLLTSGALTAVVDRLEKKALVQRLLHPQDRRIRIIELTVAGKAFIETVFAQHSQDMEAAVHGLSANERETLVGLLKKLGKQAELLLPKT